MPIGYQATVGPVRDATVSPLDALVNANVRSENQPHVVTTILSKPAPEATGRAGFHRDDARRLFAQKLLQSSSRKNPLNSTAPPRSVAQTWKLRFAKSIARIRLAVICLSFASATTTLSGHHKLTQAEGGIHPISSGAGRTSARSRALFVFAFRLDAIQHSFRSNVFFELFDFMICGGRDFEPLCNSFDHGDQACRFVLI